MVPSNDRYPKSLIVNDRTASAGGRQIFVGERMDEDGTSLREVKEEVEERNEAIQQPPV